MKDISIVAVFITLIVCIVCMTIYYTTVDKRKVLTDPLAQQLSEAIPSVQKDVIKAYYAHKDSCK